MTRCPDIMEILEIAKKACYLGGEKLRSGFASQAKVKEFLPHDIKAFADLESEKAMREYLSAVRPEDAIMGEEEGGSLDTSGGCWVLDPLDGTINFVHGVPYFAVTAAFYWQGTIMAGVIFDPIADNCYWAAEGKGAFENGEKMSVSKTEKLSDAMVHVGCGKGPGFLAHWREHEKIVAKIHSVRFKCCATLDLAALAGGHCDGYKDLGLYLWDFAAGSLILKEAGGMFETTPGIEPGTYDFLGGNPPIFRELKKIQDL